MNNYQSSARSQMPKVIFKAKQVLQLAFLLGVCFWLLYQIEHSHSKRKDNGGSIQSKLSEQHGVIIFGRKGDAGRLSDGGMSELEDMNLLGEDKRKEDGGGGDDELDGNVEEEFFSKENEYAGGNLWTQEEKEFGKEPERQDGVSLNNEEHNSNVEVSKTDEAVGLYKHLVEGVYSQEGHDDSDHIGEEDEERREIRDEEGDEKDPKKQVKKGGGKDLERQLKEPERSKEITDGTLTKDQDELGSLNRDNEEDKNITESKQEIAVQPSGEANNATVVGRSEILDGVHGFHDENGVPQDGNNPLEPTLTESRDDHENILHQETTLNSSYHSRFSESSIIEEVASQEDMLAAHGETKE